MMDILAPEEHANAMQYSDENTEVQVELEQRCCAFEASGLSDGEISVHCSAFQCTLSGFGDVHGESVMAIHSFASVVDDDEFVHARQEAM